MNFNICFIEINKNVLIRMNNIKIINQKKLQFLAIKKVLKIVLKDIN